jgi:Lon protease-like protein
MEIPLFPLSSVLLPGGRLSLKIFEQRYLDLVRSCLKQDSGFGLICITEGAEVAQPGVGQPQLAALGCYARIVDWDSLPNGLLGITVEGGRRFLLESAREEDNQLVVGDVLLEEPRLAEPMHDDWQSLEEVLTSLEQHPHVQRLGLSVDHRDAWQVGYMLAQLLPVDEQIKYELLAEDNINDFMEQLDEILDQLGGLTA